MSGNVENLTKWDFGVLDMEAVVDTLEGAMDEIAGNGKIMFSKDFIMNIFSEFQEKIYPFDEYLTYKNKTKACASHKYKVEDTVLFIESDYNFYKKKLYSPSKGPYKSFSFTPMGPLTFNVECATKLSPFITYAQTIHATKITKCT